MYKRIDRKSKNILSGVAKILFVVLLPAYTSSVIAQQKNDSVEVHAEHGGINIAEKSGRYQHTNHPDAQWFPDAGFGLFLHWGIASVKGINISWSMIPGEKLASAMIGEKEKERIFREGDFDLTGKVHSPTPNQYFEMAKEFNPEHFDAEKWIRAAKQAGFTYAVLTTKHHEGFALWPSNYNTFNTSLYMGGRDLIASFVKACRKYGLKVGLYYSPPDWYFEKEYKNFMNFQTIAAHPEYPALDADLHVRESAKQDPEELLAFQQAYVRMIRGQVKELLTRYGTVDLLWFDGRPSIPDAENIISLNEIRALQPGIVINPRLHGHGDYTTFERIIPENRLSSDTAWSEFCNTWTGGWPYIKNYPFRANGYILGQLVKCRAMGINYLLGIGPMANGELENDAYKNMLEIQEWMQKNRISVTNVYRIPNGERSSVPATANGSKRFLFLIPAYKGGLLRGNQLPFDDETVVYKIARKPSTVQLLGRHERIYSSFAKGELEIRIPRAVRSDLVDVVELTF